MMESERDCAASIIWAYVDKVEADKKGIPYEDCGRFLARFPKLSTLFSKELIRDAIEHETARILSGEVRKSDPEACLATLERVRRMFIG